MNKSIKPIFLLSILLLVVLDTFSQYYVKFKGDSIGFEKDSVVLALDNVISNNISWEISKDSVTWESLNNNNDTLLIRIDNSSFYRAVLSEGTCYPIKSDVAFAGFKSIEVSGNSLVIDSIGGVYILPSGIKIVVPPNAVTENITVTLDLLDSLNAEVQIPFDADTGKVFCAAIYCETIQFLKPIKISIPAPNIYHNDLPCVYRYDSDSGFWEKFTDKLICSEASQFIEFYSDMLVSTRVQLLKDVYGFGNVVKDGEPGSQEYDCRALLGVHEVVAYDHIGQIGKTECYVNSDDVKASYPLCDGQPVETSKNIEIGKGCKPLAEDDMDKIECLKKGESATITVEVTIGGMPMKGQHIDFYQLPDGLSINKIADSTNNAGIAQFIVTCTKENFSGTIYYRVTYEYFLQVNQASAGGIVENNQNYKRTGPIEEHHFIDVCPKLSSIELTNANVMLLEAGESVQLNCICLDVYGKPMDCGNVEYSLHSWGEYPNAGATVSEPGLLTASSSGVVSIKVRSEGIESKKTKIATVEYKGSLPSLQLTSDHNIYKDCGCKEDFDNPPYKWQWWVVDYSGSLHISMYLNPDITRLPMASLTGESIIEYSIGATSYCSGATFHETINSHQTGWLLFPGETKTSPYLMENMVKGSKCIVEFEYEDFTGWYWHILRGTVQLTPNGIDFSILDWRPDGCTHRDVEGSCVLK